MRPLAAARPVLEAGAVQVTVAAPVVVLVALTPVGALCTTMNGTVVPLALVNSNLSTLRRVSTPSLIFCGATGATVWFTVIAVAVVPVTVKLARGPFNTAVSQFSAAVVAAVGNAQSAAGPVGVTISRTPTRLPGSTRPAKTACCNVIPVVAGPKLPVLATPSIRSVEPISVAAFAGSVRTLILTCRARSPSMMSLAPRPLIESLPRPPMRMSPSAQTFPPVVDASSGQAPAAEAATIGASGDGKVVTNWLSPPIRATPAASRASQPVNPAPPMVLGATEVPLMMSLNADPELASVSCHRSRLTTTWIGTPTRLLLISMSSSAPTVSYWWKAQSKTPAPALRYTAAFCDMTSSPPSAS